MLEYYLKIRRVLGLVGLSIRNERIDKKYKRNTKKRKIIRG